MTVASTCATEAPRRSLIIATVEALRSYLFKDLFWHFVDTMGHYIEIALALTTRLWQVSGSLIWRVTGLSIGHVSW